METTHDLLDLICLYSDRDPVQEGEPQKEDMEESEEQGNRKTGQSRQAPDLPKSIWKENNNAERIFNLLPERDTRCYSALIRGTVKHGAPEKAFSLYTDMLNNRMTADVHIFNALISAAPEVREKINDKWELIIELLNQMSQQKVQPNLVTFNSTLKALRRCGSWAKRKALSVLSEMRAVGIAPSLSTFYHIIEIYCKPEFGQGNIQLLQDILSELAGTRLTCQGPEDVMFFLSAMRIALDTKDLELGYTVHNLVEHDENWRFLGDAYRQTIYYGRFFNLLCMMEHVDELMKWYRRLVPSIYYPRVQGLVALLQALDTDNRLEMLPSVWKDIVTLGHNNKLIVVEEMLTLMARDTHSPEVQESFAECALDIKSAFAVERGKFTLAWSASSLSNITTLLLRANKTEEAWKMLTLFKSNNRVPDEALLDDFLTACHTDGSPKRAVELVQLSAAFCLSATPRLAKRALAEFDVDKEQRAQLSELESTGESSD